ncbi:hypothetical protein PRIPAC_97980, partial [Pristionchus pacificus]|uniref:Uncharacterized protein n=1 Tax=Pristionchus pacificus TaxID=54126 RepID=A0A2A6BC34_PRIPA
MVDMAKGQNEKYETLLEKFTESVNTRVDSSASVTPVTTKPSGPSIDAIEGRIVVCTFENWFERYRDVFEHDMKELDELFELPRGGADFERFSVPSKWAEPAVSSHKAPVDVMKSTFEETVTTLKHLFGKKESNFEIRVRFFNRRMSTMGSTDVMKFAGEVNRLQKGNLKKITEEQMKITIFLQNQKAMRTQLFNAVSQKSASTFQELLEKYKAFERDVAVVQKNATMMVSDEWIHVTPRPIRLVGNDLLFKLDLRRAFFEEFEDTVVAHIKSIPEFAIGDSVYYRDRDGPNHEKWSEATVLKKIGSVLYEIVRESGTKVVAHANQMKLRYVREDIDQLSVLIESFDMDRNRFVNVSPPPSPIRAYDEFDNISSPTVPRIVPAKEVENDQKTNDIEHTDVVENDKDTLPTEDLRRSHRVRKAPSRLTITHAKGQSYKDPDECPERKTPGRRPKAPFFTN